MSEAHPLKQFRSTRELTLADLAAVAGVSEATLSRIENGKQTPRAALMSKLKAITGLSADAFIAGLGAQQ